MNNKKIDKEIEKLISDLKIEITPEVLEVVEISPDIPSGGTSHCSGTSTSVY